MKGINISACPAPITTRSVSEDSSSPSSFTTRSVSEGSPALRDPSPYPSTVVEPNPFAVRFVRPGAIPFVFHKGKSASQLVELFAALGGRAQIVGPHGTGKSTLLSALIPKLERAGWTVTHIALHDGQRCLPRGWSAQLRQSQPLLIVDGYEQLARWYARPLRLWCRARGVGLLVTTHTERGLSTLWQTSTDLSLLESLLASLAGADALPRHLELARTLWHAHGGDLREVWFELYDQFETERSA